MTGLVRTDTRAAAEQCRRAAQLVAAQYLEAPHPTALALAAVLDTAALTFEAGLGVPYLPASLRARVHDLAAAIVGAEPNHQEDPS